jgi:secreted trypsin-like serine protease
MIILLVSVLSACSTSEQISKSEANIIGGHKDQGSQHQSVLFMLTTANELCTGSLIAPRVIVTAKHCVLGHTVDQIRFGFGPDFASGVPYKRVTNIRTTEGFDTEGKDIALLLLESEGTLEPIPWQHSSTDLLFETVTLVGYGQQSTGDPRQVNYGEKAITTSSIIATSTFEFAIDGPSTCFGDSGGPALLDSGLLVGIVSRGQERCTGSSVLTRVDAFTAFINSAILDTNGTVDETSGSQQAENNTLTSANTATSGTVLKGMPKVGGGGCNILQPPQTRFADKRFLWAFIMALVFLCCRSRRRAVYRSY